MYQFLWMKEAIPGAYDLAWQTISNTLSHEIGWLLRDYLYLLPLVIFIAVLTVLKKQPQSRLILDTLIWMFGWLGIYLPWHLLLEYYLLPFALGGAILGGVSFGQIWVHLTTPSQPRYLRPLAAICLTLTLAPWPILLANHLTNARLQVTIDEANADFLDFSTTLPPQTKVLLNLARINEYVIKTGPLLAITRARDDITFDYFEFQTASPQEPDQTYYVAVPQMENQTLPAVRIAVHEPSTARWNETLSHFLPSQAEPIFQTERQVKLLDIGLHRLSCPLFNVLQIDGLFCFFQRSNHRYTDLFLWLEGVSTIQSHG